MTPSTFSPSQYLAPLHTAFTTHQNHQDAVLMKKYLKDLFPFYGIKAPKRKEVFKAFIKEQGLPDKRHLAAVAQQLWEYDQREYQHFALEILRKFQKKWEENDVKWLESLVIQKSWWDTVDMLATNMIASYFKLFPDKIKPITTRWIDDSNMWLNRTAILFQLKYKDQTDVPLLLAFIEKHKDSKEFFHQKAIGWALREYSKLDADMVIAFVQSTDLAPLSKREALKWIKK